MPPLSGAPSVSAYVPPLLYAESLEEEVETEELVKAHSVGLEAGQLLKKICLPERVQIQNCC